MVDDFDNRQLFDARNALVRLVMVDENHAVRRRGRKLFLEDHSGQMPPGIEHRHNIGGGGENPASLVAQPLVRRESQFILRKMDEFDRGAEFEPADHGRRIEPGFQDRNPVRGRFLQNQRIDRAVAGHDQQSQFAVQRAQVDFGPIADDERQIPVVRRDMLLEAVEPHGGDVDVEFLFFGGVAAGQDFGFEHAADQVDRAVDAPSGQVAAV